MPLNLVARSGQDTLGKLEAAARVRLREAKALQAGGQKLGALYLYGYVIEITLKAAYYRTIGLVPQTSINRGLHRQPAEDQIRSLPGLPSHPSGGPTPGHHLVGWASLLVSTRANHPAGKAPLPPGLASDLQARVQACFPIWAEFLRYRANRPYDKELRTISQTAQWLRRSYGRLWR